MSVPLEATQSPSIRCNAVPMFHVPPLTVRSPVPVVITELPDEVRMPSVTVTPPAAVVLTLVD